jgi:hypothetical protein
LLYPEITVLRLTQTAHGIAALLAAGTGPSASQPIKIDHQPSALLL